MAEHRQRSAPRIVPGDELKIGDKEMRVMRVILSLKSYYMNYLRIE
jgi:hypothetical protein